MSFLNEMAARLHSLNIVRNVDGATRTVFLGSKAIIPDGDGPYVHLRETGGWSPLLQHNSDTVPAYRRPSAQVVVLGQDPDATLVKAQQVWDAFVQKRTLVINGTYYVSIDVGGDISDVLGVDDAGRIRYSFNISAVKRPS